MALATLRALSWGAPVRRARRFAMRTPITEKDWRELPPRLRPAFAPLDKRAFGLAVGVVFGGGLLLLTAYHLLFSDLLIRRIDVLEGQEYSGSGLWLLAQYFRGYSPESWAGALVGALWGLWSGFVMGWFVALCRNVLLALWLLFLRARQNLAASRGFLDQI